MAASLFAGLVAVPNRMVGGFNVYMTGGQRDPSQWLRGTLGGDHWIEGRKADLIDIAHRYGRQARRVADFYALEA